MRRGLLVMVVVAGCAIALSSAVALADPATFVVTSTADPGDGVCDSTCTFREALNAANSTPDADRIEFEIPGAGPHTITYAQSQTFITQPVTIDATTQNGYNGTPLVELDANNNAWEALWFSVNSGTSAVRGLAINRWNGMAAVVTQSGVSLTLQGNYIGVSPDGTTARPNSNGVIFLGGSNHVVGGAGEGQGNVISGNFAVGVRFQDVAGATVRGNRIGTNAAGTAALANGLGDPFNPFGGLEITPTGLTGASGIVIGGAGAGEGNVISGNGRSGIDIYPSSGRTVDDTTIQGNRIGTNAAGTAGIANGWNGIHIRGFNVNGPTTDTTIGGTGTGEGNTIAFNGRDGVAIDTNAPGPENLRNSIRRNVIHSNGGFNGLGIDLDVNGVTANDPDDADSGANGLQNFPVLTSVNTGGGETFIEGTFDGTPNTTFALDLFVNTACDASGNGEGRTYIGAGTAATSGDGDGTFMVQLIGEQTIGEFVTATATDPTGNTSEFSACRTVAAGGGPQLGPNFEVNTTEDAAPADAGCSTVDCTLREAIDAANAQGGSNTIILNIPGAGVRTIAPTTPLPTITDPVSIVADASNLDPDGLPYVRLDGGSFGSGSPAVFGLTFDIPETDASSLSGLAFTRWTRGNATAIRIDGASPVTVTGTLVGTDQTLATGLGNYGGIWVSNASTIGGTTLADRNWIVGSNFPGVFVIGPGGAIQGNWIGQGPDGAANGNGRGVQVDGGSNVLVGGTTDAAGNLITENGVGVKVFNGAQVAIRRNSIVANSGIGIDLGSLVQFNGVTPNDPPANLDADAGPNGLQNFPILSAASPTVVSGVLDSAVDTYTIDLYSNPSCDPSGHGEGATHVKSFVVVTDVFGHAGFAEAVTLGSGVVTATATDSLGNTSEFSPCKAVAAGPQPGPTFTVNTTADAAPADAGCSEADCTLREAIVAANGLAGADTIEFGIPGSGPHTIQPATALPSITEAVTIDGTSEPDYVSAPVVEIDGTTVSAGDGPWHGLRITGDDSVVQALAINDFTLVGAGVGIEISGGARNSVEASYIGTDVAGSVARPNGNGIEIVASADENTIGGSAAARNVISGNDGRGVMILDAGTSLNVVDNNYIGLDATGMSGLGNGVYGVQIQGAGTNTVRGNLISDNAGGGVLIGGAGPTANQLVDSNGIGVNEAGTTLSQPGVGVGISNSSGHLVVSNTIAGHTDVGILVDEFGGAATGNAFRFNAIRQNVGLGIDLVDASPRGVTLNDPGDGDVGANGLQNFPDLTAATAGAGETVIDGTLNSLPGTSFQLDFFWNTACDASGNGEGSLYLDSHTVVTDGGGNIAFSKVVTGAVLPVGAEVTATATGPDGTSEFSGCTAVVALDAPLTVNTVADTPPDGCTPADCTLREAIEAANADPGESVIDFDIEGAPPHVIALASPLPAIVEDTTIDATTEPDWVDSPVVGLDGQLAVATGLEVADNATTVLGLAIGGFTSYGINADGGQLRLSASYIGTNLAGTAANPNGIGVRVQGSGHVIGDVGVGNVISGNFDQGLLVEGANNLVQSNRIGTNPLGIEELPNTTGIEILSTAADALAGNRIGGDQAGEGNVISGNTSAGVLLRSLATGDGVTETEITGNLIGIAADGTTDLGNGGDGVQLGSVGNLFNNTIGGTLPGEANRIAHNDGAAVSILNADGSNRGNAIRGNSIFANGGIGIDLGADGPTANDDGVLDADTGANDLQNFPVLTLASPTTLSGTLDSEPDETYQIHVYENETCGEGGWGTTYLASFPVITDGSGTVTFTDAPLGVVATGRVSVTATDSENNTSELSACIPVTIPTYVVNSSGIGDVGTPDCELSPCQLDEAIELANDQPGPARIQFELTGSEIPVSSTLPALTDEVEIDGNNFGEGRVILRDASVDVTDGLTLAAGSGGSAVHGLKLEDFQTALRVQSNANTVRNNRVEASNVGIRIEAGAAGNLIGGSADSGHGNRIWDTLTGIQLDTAGTGNEIAGNTIGLDLAGAPTTGEAGIEVRDTSGTTIGDDAGPSDLFVMDFDRANVISGLTGEAGNGIELDGADNTRATGNFIGTNRAGTADLGNNGRGITVFGSDGNQIGPGNRIAHNGSVGVRVASSSGNRIVANSIFENAGDGIALVEANESVATPPALQPLDTEGGDTVVDGTISGTIGQFLFIEYFTNSDCAAGNGEGETFLGFTSLTLTEESQPFSASFAGLAPDVGITVTATDPSTNETSEFSNCATFATAAPPPAPVLFGAVPDVVATPEAPPGMPPLSLGVAGLVDSGQPGAGQAYDVDFYSADSCLAGAGSEPLGTGQGFVTNADGVAGFAKQGLQNVEIGTAIVATATNAGGTSERSNCVVADRNNTSWHTAHGLQPNGNDTGALRASGEARWFKVPILPNSRVDVSLTNLPDDYDMVVFSDIQQAYDRILGSDYEPTLGPNLSITDIERAEAEKQEDVFNTSQYDSASWDPTNWDPSLNTAAFSASQWSASQWSPSQWSASQWSPSQWSASQWSASQWSASQWSASQWSPSQWSASQWSPSQWSASQWSTSNPADPRAFTGAQTASLLAASGGPGTGDETVSVNTWNNTGHFYIRVQGKNGAFDADTPFSLSTTRTGSLCQGVVPPASSSAPTAATGLGSPKTLILYDSRRIDEGPFLGRLNELAARPEVAGHVIDVDADATVRSLNTQADANSACPYAKNLVAGAIKRIVMAYRDAYPSIQYLVVVGDDASIPFYRYADPALMGNESLYVPPVRDNTHSQSSLRLGYILTDDFLASSIDVEKGGKKLPPPDIASGRLVETPQEIAGMLDAYLLGTNGGVVPTPTSSLVTGYDFLADAADEIQGHLSAGIGQNNRTLITAQGIAPGDIADPGDAPSDDKSWNADNLRSALLGPQRNDLVFLAGHFSANDALAADYKTNVLSTEVPAAPTDMENTIVFSAGCHAGYNIVNGDATTWTEPLDWAQAFAQKRATLISGTGYQYGDTDFLAHGERIYAEFARQLRVTTQANLAPEPVAVGSALLRSKQIFLEKTPGLTALDEKSLLQTTLFGLPMTSVNLPQGRILDPPSVPVVEEDDLEDVGSGPGADLGLKVAPLEVGPTLDPQGKTLTNLVPQATWLEGPDGVAVRPTQPILPLRSLDVTSPIPDTALRGVAIREATYIDTGGVTPLTAAPATELRGIHAPFFADVFHPAQAWTTSYFSALRGGSTLLHVTPVQHRSESPTMTRRVFSDIDFRLFYSGNVASYCPSTTPLTPTPPACAPTAFGPVTAVTPALAAPPTVQGVETSFNDDTDRLTFRARALGDPFAGIQSVWVTWTIPPGLGVEGMWRSLDLAKDGADETLWTGELQLGPNVDPGSVHFSVVAVNGLGRVTVDSNVGAFYRPGSIPGQAPPAGQPAPVGTELAFTPQPPASVVYGDSFTVTAKLTSGVVPVEGKLVKIGFGANGLPAITGADGLATVTLQASLSPDSYPVTARFAGDADYAQSDASATTAITPRPTTLTLSGSFTTAPTSVSAELKAGTTPLHQRTVFIVFTSTLGPAPDVFTGKTGPTGVVEVTPQFLAALPAANYRIDAYFNGVTLPGPVVVPPDSPEYGPSTATANIVFRPPAGSRLDQAIALLDPLAALPGNPGGKARDTRAKIVAAKSFLDRPQPDRVNALTQLIDGAGILEGAVKNKLLTAAQTRPIFDLMTGAAWAVALEARDLAIARGGNPGRIAEANTAINQGNARWAAGRFKDAISSYKTAVVKAQSA